MIFIVVAVVLIVVLGAGAFIFKDALFGTPGGSPPGGTGAVPQPTPVEMDNVIVLTQNISFGQSIPDSAIALAPIPKGGYEGLYFKSKEAIKGKRARYQLQAGTILTVGMLSESAVGSWASSQIPPGYVAISIPITKYTSVSYALQAGDHVSVMVALMLEELDPNFQSKLPNYSAMVAPPGSGTVTVVTGEKSTSAPATSLTLGITAGGESATVGRTELEPVLNKPIYIQPSESQRPRIVTQLLVSDAMVLYVGKFPKDGGASGAAQAAAPTPTPAPGVTPTPGPAPAVATDPEEITLVVTPQDAVTLNYIMLTNGAKLNLALRGTGEDANKDAKTEAVTLQFLMDQYNIPFPSKLPYGLEPRDNSLNYFHPTPAPAAGPAPAQ
jgi:pilus assembly protein CpaB